MIVGCVIRVTEQELIKRAAEAARYLRPVYISQHVLEKRLKRKLTDEEKQYFTDVMNGS